MNDVSKTIRWADVSWNPVSGCRNNCPYCYARKIYRRFKKPFWPQIHYKRLDEPCKTEKPLRIFTCSVSDLWGLGVPPAWRAEVWNIMYACPQHAFLTLTKQPQRIRESDWPQLPENLWLGVTVTGEGDEWRADYLHKHKGVKFVSFEPLIRRPLISLRELDWIILGAMTGPGSKKYVPKKEWILELLDQARLHKIPVFMKDNLKTVWPGVLRQEFPK